MTTKNKEPLFATPSTREEMLQMCGALSAHLTRREELQAILAARLDDIRVAAMPEIERIKAEESEYLDALERYALQNPEVWGGRKTIDTGFGSLGWRTCPPALKLVSKWTWAKVVSNILHRFPGWIKTTHALDKKRVLAEAASFPDTELRNLGMRIERAEQFRFDKSPEGGGE